MTELASLESTRTVSFTVNGRTQSVQTEPRVSLADTLRDELGLHGTKLGCEQGICGACTVLVDGVPVRSCLTLTVRVEGRKIETVESLATGPALSKLQEAFQRNHALQCGFCTAGFLMVATALLRENPTPTAEEARAAIDGNICRCTGYRNIVDAVVDAGRPSSNGEVESS